MTLKKFTWVDPNGRERPWEVAQRKTRGSAGIDGVAVLALLTPSTPNAFKPSTVIIEQYRPPVGQNVVELPAGLIDGSESAESAAMRELTEETGYESTEVLESSTLMVSDPGASSRRVGDGEFEGESTRDDERQHEARRAQGRRGRHRPAAEAEPRGGRVHHAPRGRACNPSRPLEGCVYGLAR